MSALFYGLPIGGGDWIVSQSKWIKDGKVFLYVNDKWVEVEPKTEFHIVR